MAATQAKQAGMKKVGEWGISRSDAVRAAYDAADEANPDLTDIIDAGGVYCRDAR